MAHDIDATKITSVTIADACPGCAGSGEQVWCKARADSAGNAYIYHNKCGWQKDTGQKWPDYVQDRINQGFIHYTDAQSLIAPWDIRPGMEKVLYGAAKPESKKCFIATAAYGTDLAPEVRLLQNFRDQYLVRQRLGLCTVRVYYAIAPQLAAVIDKCCGLRWLTRNLLLRPIVQLLRFFMATHKEDRS